MHSFRSAAPRVPRSCSPTALAVIGAGLLALALVLAQLLVAPSSAQAKPSEKPEKIYVSPANLGDGAKAPVPVATSWLVADLDTGQVHASRAIDTRHAPASTIKLLTALALVDVLDDPKQKVEAVYEDMEIDGTKVGLMQKNSYTVDLLFHAMLMSSANDAAHALGRAAGGQAKAVELMNTKARSLGMTNTLATDTSGLDDIDQYTTAADMAKLAWAVCENPYLMAIIGTETYRFPGGKNPETKKKFKGYQFQNHTKVVGQVEGGLGLKNGFTKKAKGSYIAVAKRGDHRVVSTLLGAENNSRQSAVDLLEWDFAQKAPTVQTTVALGPAAPSPVATATAGTDAAAASATDRSSAAPSSTDVNDGSTDGYGHSSWWAWNTTTITALILLLIGVAVLVIAIVKLRRLRRSRQK